MNSQQLDDIFRQEILPLLQAKASPSKRPCTIFLGGQPGAGKTRAQMRAMSLYEDESRLLPIVGDDFRQYHPDYQRLINEEPTHMPDATASAAGYWTGKAVKWADDNNISCIIEGTWRNSTTVLDEAKNAKQLNRATHAIIVAVPPVLSRLGILERYYLDLQREKAARWTPPFAHETTVAKLRQNIPAVSESRLMDRLTVTNRNGETLYDGTNAGRFVNAWNAGFSRQLTEAERAFAQKRIEILKNLIQQYTPNNTEIRDMLASVEQESQMNPQAPATTSVHSAGSGSGGCVYVSAHTRNGYPVQGYWRSH